MKLKPNTAQVSTPASSDDKALGAANARGPRNTTPDRPTFKQQEDQAQGKRYTFALVADLRLYPAKKLRELLPNRRALVALDLAEALCYRYVIAAGQLMASNADVFAITLASDADVETLTTSVLTAHSRMSEISDTTAWTILLSNDMRSTISQRLEAKKS